MLHTISDKKAKRSEIDKEITSLVNTEVILKNRYNISTSIDIVDFLADHQLTFRGKIHAFESEVEGGNGLFSSLFNYVVEKDQCLPEIIKSIPRNATYTRSDLQNELIVAISSIVTEGIRQEIGKYLVYNQS